MKAELRSEVLRNCFWYASLLTALALLIGGTLWSLGRRRSDIDALEGELSTRRAALRGAGDTHHLPSHLDHAREASSSWFEMVAKEPARLAELAATARASGVRIVSLRTADGPKTSEANASEAVLQSSHELQGVGSYEQLGTFLDALQEADGVVSIETLEIRPDSDLPAGLLNASLLVSWYALDPTAPDEEQQS